MVSTKWATITLLVAIITTIVGGVGSYNSYKNYNYKIKLATRSAYTAENTLDRNLIAQRMNNSLNHLSELNGNYAWWFPTDETNIDNIKASIESIISECINGNATDWQLTNIINSIESVIVDLEIAGKVIPRNSIYLIYIWILAIITWIICLVILMAGVYD
jgi:hypothetical protein